MRPHPKKMWNIIPTLAPSPRRGSTSTSPPGSCSQLPISARGTTSPLAISGNHPQNGHSSAHSAPSTNAPVSSSSGSLSLAPSSPDPKRARSPTHLNSSYTTVEAEFELPEDSLGPLIKGTNLSCPVHPRSEILSACKAGYHRKAIHHGKLYVYSQCVCFISSIKRITVTLPVCHNSS